MTSLSTRFFGHPRLMNPAFRMKVSDYSSMAQGSYVRVGGPTIEKRTSRDLATFITTFRILNG